MDLLDKCVHNITVSTFIKILIPSTAFQQHPSLHHDEPEFVRWEYI